jgi:hypothetical protein
MMRRLRSLFARKPKPAPKRRTPSPARLQATARSMYALRRTSPNARQSGALGSFLSFPAPKRRTPTPKRRRTSPSVRRSAALGPFWKRGNYAYRQGPLKSTF